MMLLEFELDADDDDEVVSLDELDARLAAETGLLAAADEELFADCLAASAAAMTAAVLDDLLADDEIDAAAWALLAGVADVDEEDEDSSCVRAFEPMFGADAEFLFVFLSPFGPRSSVALRLSLEPPFESAPFLFFLTCTIMTN